MPSGVMTGRHCSIKERNENMIKIAISGICGHMGRNVYAAASERADCEVICGIDIGEASACPVPVYKTPADMP